MEYRKILEFGSRWNDLLVAMGLKPINQVGGAGLAGADSNGGWGGGESAAHKSLKHFVATHPERFGAGRGEDWTATEEFALRSQDAIDVFFKSDRLWVGVEVKSVVSDGNKDDYERGLFQVVKYRAVLEAQARLEVPDAPPEVRVILALERTLPEIFRHIATTLNLAVMENVRSVAP